MVPCARCCGRSSKMWWPSKAKTVLERELGFGIPAEAEQQLGNILGPLFGDNQFDNIVRFMAGRTPSECSLGEASKPGTEKCIALVYEGMEAAAARYADIL